MYIRCTYGLYNAEKFIGFRLVSVDKFDELVREVSTKDKVEGYAIVGILPLNSESSFSCDIEGYISLEYYNKLSDANLKFKELLRGIEEGVSSIDISIH